MSRNRSYSPMSFSIPPSSSRTMNREISPRVRNASPLDFYEQVFDFTAVPLTSRFEFDSTEEKFFQLQDKIALSKSNLNSCPKCFEYLNLIQDLEDLCKSYSKHRTRLLNSFFEIYLNLQEECKRSKDIHLKYHKLQQEIEENLGNLTDRKINNKIKSLKNEIKHKSSQIAELSEKLKLIEGVSEFKSKLEISQNISKEITERDKVILTMQQIIKEKLPGAVLPSNLACKDCAKKNLELETLRNETTKLKESLSKDSKVLKDVKNPMVKSMVEILEKISVWWDNKQDFPNPAWKREGEELVLSLSDRVVLMAESAIEQPGRELRSAVHKKIIEIEAEFLDLEKAIKGMNEGLKVNQELSEIIEKIKRITENFLQLPYLLKPLFDLLKDYEKKELVS